MDKVVHFELPADDTGRAKNFYQTVFGWQINKAPMPGPEYHMVVTVATDEKQMPKEVGAINGGLFPREHGEAPILVISVSSIDAYLEKVTAEGGKIVTPKIQMGEMGLYARFADTEGNILGLWQDLSH